MSNSLKKNFLFNSILTTSNYIFPLLVYPYITRVLGVANIGLCDFVDSIINYFILFSMMGINIMGTREIAKAKNNKEDLNKVFSSLFVINLTATLIALLVLVAVSFLVPKLHEHLNLMLLGVVKLVFNFLLINWFFQGMEDFKYVTIRTIVVKTVYVISIFIFIRGTEDYAIYYLLTVLMVVVNAIINLAYSKRIVTFTITGMELKPYLKTYFILGLYLLLCSMYTTFNIAYLGFVCDNEQVGYYTSAAKLFNIALAFFTAFSTVALPRLSIYIAENNFEKYKSMLNSCVSVLVSLAVPIILFCVFNSYTIINILAGSGYEGAVLPLCIVMPLMFIIGYEQILIVQGLMPLQKDRDILTNSLIGAGAGVLLNLVLVSKLGAIGSSIVWILSETIVMICAQYFMKKYVNLKFPGLVLVKQMLGYLPLTLCFVFLHNYIKSQMIEFLLTGVLIVTYFIIVNCIVFKNEIIIKTLHTIRAKLLSNSSQI